jgi:SPP1 family predicted phage head-tail adaptor
MQSGDLRERIGFYARVSLDDGAGNVKAGYGPNPEFILSANVKPKLGGEGVLAGRLTGTNLLNITVRYSSKSTQVTPDWRAKDERSGVIYNIRSIVDPTQKRQWLELLCERGVAT